MLHQIYFDFHGSTIRVQSKDLPSLAMLEREFSYFLRPKLETTQFILELVSEAPPAGLIPPIPAARISPNALTYLDGERQWNDFGGEALSSWDFALHQGVVFSAHPDRLHEVAYLLILSLTGKDMDRRGLHKVHACAFRYRQRDVLVMLPSGGGKSTLFIEIARLPGVELLSDDTPLVDAAGRVHPFPSRLGITRLPEHLGKESDFPLFRRHQHGDKFLIPLDQLGAPLAHGVGNSVVLIFGQRWPSAGSFLRRLTPLQTLRGLTEHMVVGVGLPMVVEFFVRHTWRDWGVLIGIAWRRSRAALRLSQRGAAYEFIMGQDPAANARSLLAFLEER